MSSFPCLTGESIVKQGIMGSINRKELIEFHNVILDKPETDSPLTVGNGSFAYTFDITGMQTLYNEYADRFPLCTMAEWGWHTTPADNKKGFYTPEDFQDDEYKYLARKVHYPVTRKPGNEDVYDWLRENPHRYNLARIGLFYKGNEIVSGSISSCKQELKPYEGICDSNFVLNNDKCSVTTFVYSKMDTLCFRIKSELLVRGLEPRILFPYPSWKIHGSDWSSSAQQRHKLEIISKGKESLDNIKDAESSEILCIRRIIDSTEFTVTVYTRGAECVCDMENKAIRIVPESTKLELMITFSKTPADLSCDYETCISQTKEYWKNFWEHGGIIRLRNSKDSRASELERRIILSMYLMAVQCTGTMPPQETGLTVNSWYGKFHLEMYLWHQAYLPLWNRGNLLKKSIPWFRQHLLDAENNAVKNGFKGARWPKMIAETAIDSPSPIAPLLVWQQPHIIHMLELCYNENPSEGFLKEHIDIVTKTAEFMADFSVLDKKDNKYHLLPPLIPAQECHNPVTTKDPAFEMEYFVSGLMIAVKWYKRLSMPVPKKWVDVIEKMTESPFYSGKYQAHAGCTDTFISAAIDHPSMLCAYGLIDNGRIDTGIMKSTLETVIKAWDYDSLWGWDFAVMAMTAARLGLKDMVIDLLLSDTPKNRYVKSGNNAQGERKDLPLYLPGNGSLLLAMPLLVTGVEGKLGEFAGFPDDGSWCVEYEDIRPFPW